MYNRTLVYIVTLETVLELGRTVDDELRRCGVVVAALTFCWRPRILCKNISENCVLFAMLTLMPDDIHSVEAFPSSISGPFPRQMVVFMAHSSMSSGTAFS